MAIRCLIVDDNVGFLSAAAELLEGQEVTVVAVASTAAEALERVRQLKLDVVLVDIELGAESGFDLVRQLAHDSAGRSVGVILVSTYAERDFADLIRESPALGFVSKSDLSAETIRATLAGSSGQGKV